MEPDIMQQGQQEGVPRVGPPRQRLQFVKTQKLTDSFHPNCPCPFPAEAQAPQGGPRTRTQMAELWPKVTRCLPDVPSPSAASPTWYWFCDIS